jgi:hypothetical protein
MKRVGLYAASVAIVALVVLPAAAQALEWEVKGPPAVFTPLPAGVPETVHTTGKLNIVGKGPNGAFKAGCATTDTEIIENEVGGEGVDKMTAFLGQCGTSGPFPCGTNEGFELRGGSSLPWPSELLPSMYDAFENVTLEVECSNHNTALYHPPGHVWSPKVITNGLKSNAASGVFKDGPGKYFWIEGTDQMKAAAHASVR